MNEDPDAAKKEAAAVRGIGLTKCYVYIEDPEDKDGDEHVVVSLTDYFEGESTEIVANEIEEDLSAGAAVTPVAPLADRCGGTIAGIDLLVCVKEARYPLPTGTNLRITVTYAGVAQSVDISKGNRKAWLDWS